MFSAVKQSIQDRSANYTLQSDILAGLTVGVIALPLSMALAIAIGVAPQHGLYTAIVAGMVIALTGGSRVSISGPTAAFVVVLLPIVQQFGLGGLLISGMLAGVILVLMGLFRLGKLIEIVPYPVVIGFTTGVGVVIAVFQIKDLFGLTVPVVDGHFIDKVVAIFQSFNTFDLPTFIVAAITFGVLLIWPKMHSKIPGHLVALLVGSLLALGMSELAPQLAVDTIGSRFSFDIAGMIGQGIPPIAPSFEWPWNLPDAQGQPIGLSFGLIQSLLPAAITIAILGALESLLCAVVADGMTGKKHQPNDELIGQGLGNILVPFFGGIPATAAIARTAGNIKFGGSTPLASVVHALFILLAILLLAPLLSYIPMASMAALLLMVAWNMSEAKHFINAVRVAPLGDVGVLLTCFSLTVLFDMTIAVAIGMGLAAILFIKKSIDLTSGQQVKPDFPEQDQLPTEIAVYDINGPLFFGTAQKAMSQLTYIAPNVRVVVLDMAEVTMVDMSALMAMQNIVNGLDKNNVGLIISHLEPRLLLKLRKAGVRKQNGVIEFANTLPEAIEKAKNMLQ